MSAPPPFPGSPRPSSGYCSSSDDELVISSLVVATAGVPSDRRRSSCSTSGPSSSVSGGSSCPVTPDSATSDINFSASGLLFDEDCLGVGGGGGGLDSAGFLLLSNNGCDVGWLRSPDDLGLDLDLDDLGSGIPDVFCVAGSRTSSSVDGCGSLFVGASVFETGNGDDLTGSGRLGGVRRRFPHPASSRLSGCEEEALPEAARCQRIPISVKLADSSSSSNDDSVVARRAQLPSDRGSRDNATRTRRVAMTTTTTTTKPESSKRTMICRVTDYVNDVNNDVTNYVTNDVIDDVTNDVTNYVTNDVIDDVTVVETPRHVLSDHGYSTASPSLLFPPLPPPAKRPRLFSPAALAVPPPAGAVVREASILAALLLTKEPLRANAGSDALVALADCSRRGHQGPGPSPQGSVLEGLLLTGRGSMADNVVRTPDCVSGWKAPFSGLAAEEEGEEGFVLDSDHLLRDKDGLHVGLTSAEDDFTWTTTSHQMSSLEMDDLFTQHFEPDDLWMHLSDLL